MDETIYVILKVLLDFALEVWFSIYLSLSGHVFIKVQSIKQIKYLQIFSLIC